MDSPIEFDLIEAHKENIEPVREGRSANALKQVLTTPQGALRQQQQQERSQIEQKLEDIEELDDPIQPYLDYIEWTVKNFPTGRSVESGLLQLLERCTSQFRDVQFYKNDPRYLKVWLSYAKYSENPRDIFIYLSRKEIGKQLASYYEEYANYLEAIGKNAQACQVYEEGIKQDARPLSRLQKRYNEYKSRHTTDGLSSSGQESPVFATRSALSVKSGTALFSVHEDTKSKQKRKLDIFNDPEGSPGLKIGGWDNLKSTVFRNKENRLEATSWVGETLPQENTTPKPKFNKVAVFKDDSDFPTSSVFKIIQVPGKKPEKVDLNFDLLHDGEEEFCIQEILAIMKGVRTKVQEDLVQEDINEKDTSPLKLDEEHRPDTDKTIQLRPKYLKKRPSPTATLYTKEAKDEIYSMFNTEATEAKTDNEDEAELIYDDFTEQLTRPVPSDLTEHTELKKRRLETNDLQSLIQKTCVVAPADDTLKELLLSELTPSLSTYEGFYCYDKIMNMSLTLKKSLNIKQSRHVFIEFEGTHNPYNLKSLLGEGGFACVYLAESMNGDLKAIKCQKPSSAWEFYILTQVHRKLKGDTVLTSVVCPDELHFYGDESYLILDYIEKGTILDVVNIYRSAGRPVDEVIVVFFASELLKVVESIHNVGILHGDLKADNCMLRIGGNYNNADPKSWKERGIKLIDFGRSIDMSLFPKNVEFKCNWKTDAQDCPEMRNKETWTYQADYFGIAGIIHTMLYGCFIETKFDGKKHVLSSPIKRYWQQDIWNPLFDFLINSKSYGPSPQTGTLRNHRLKMERWLEENDGNLITTLKEIRNGLK